MRNVLRALLALCVVTSLRALAAETPGLGADGVATDSERTILVPPEASETKPAAVEEIGGGSREPVAAPAEYSGYGADELPSRE